MELTTDYPDYFDENSTFPTFWYEDTGTTCYVMPDDVQTPLAVQVALVLLNVFATLVSAAVFGVYLFMWKVLKTSDLLMCTMSLCSFLLCVLFFVHYTVARLFGEQEASVIYCSAITYTYNLLVIFVLLLTCAVSMVSLLAVARPAAQRRLQERCTGLLVVFCVLFLALIFALPFLLFRESYEDPFGTNLCLSTTVLIDDRKLRAQLKVHSSLLLCFLCFAFTVVCYLYIWCSVWCRRRRGQSSGFSMAQRRGLCLSMLILVFMLLTYGPNFASHVIYIAVHHRLLDLGCAALTVLFKVTRYLKVLVQVHAILNPILSAAVSSAFRAQALEARRRVSGLLARLRNLFY